MKQIVVGSSTHVDKHNTRMTKEALESMARQINSSRKPVLTIEHDTTLPPVGKLLNAWIEPTEDGEYRLLIEQEWFEKEERIVLPSGVQGFMRQSELDNNPFVNKAEIIPDHISLGADLANFVSLEEYEIFIADLKQTSPVFFENQEIGRKAHIPDPEIIITLSKEILAYLATKGIIDKFGGKIADKLTDKVSDDITDFYIWVRSVATKSVKYIIPRNRPITYVFSVPMIPHIELVARTSDAKEVSASIMEDNLEKPLKEAQELRDRLGAERVQFLLDKSGSWKINYLLTDKGQVIGTRESFSRKARQVDLIAPSKMISEHSNQPRLINQRLRNTTNKLKSKRRKNI